MNPGKQRLNKAVVYQRGAKFTTSPPADAAAAEPPPLTISVVNSLNETTHWTIIFHE